MLTSIGVRARWLPDSNDLEIVPPARLDIGRHGRRGRRGGPAASSCSSGRMPALFVLRLQAPVRGWLRPRCPHDRATPAGAAGCLSGSMSSRPTGSTRCTVESSRSSPTHSDHADRAGRHGHRERRCGPPRSPPVLTVIRNAKPELHGPGSVRLPADARRADRRHRHHHAHACTGVRDIDMDVEYYPSEDPIEAMSLIAAAVVTESDHHHPSGCRSSSSRSSWPPLEEMGLKFDITEEYRAAQRPHPAARPHHPPRPAARPRSTRSHPMPFPGLNIDNLPFFALIAACADGTTMIHDWVYENRAIYLTELTKVGGQVQLLDPHRVMIDRPDAEVARRRGDVPAGAAPGRRHPARDARRARHLGAAQRLRHQPRLRGPRRAAQRPRRARSRPSATSESAGATADDTSGATSVCPDHIGRCARAWWRASPCSVPPVTGAASGIGAAMVRRFVEDGADVCALDLDGEALDAMRSALKDDGLDAGRVEPLVADLAAPDATAGLPTDVDVLVNDAGLQHVSPIHEFPPESFEYLRVLLLGRLPPGRPAGDVRPGAGAGREHRQRQQPWRIPTSRPTSAPSTGCWASQRRWRSRGARTASRSTASARPSCGPRSRSGRSTTWRHRGHRRGRRRRASCSRRGGKRLIEPRR